MNERLTSLYITCLNSLSSLSWRSIFLLSDGLRWVLFDLIGYRKKVIMANLRNSFPEKSESEIATVARGFYKHFTDIIFETIKFRTASPDVIRDRLQGDISIVHDLYEQNKSIVFLMAHRGNWELANLFSSLSFSHDCIVVYHSVSNKGFDKWMFNLRTRFGAQLVPMDQILPELQKPRVKPFVVVLVNDQSPNPKTAYWTTFLNQETGIFRGVETIARRMNLAVLYAEFSKVEGRRGYYHVEITPITDCPKELPSNAILEKQVRILEKDIRRQPENWLWSHRRWKHRKPVA
jgi:KDO2-lipid IV(A) lauroyltransferase